MKIKNLFKTLFMSYFVITGLTACDNDNEEMTNTKVVKIYNASHGKTNLADMNVYLNANDEFVGLREFEFVELGENGDMRFSLLGEYESIQDVDVSFFYSDLRKKVEIGKFYAAASYDYMFILPKDTYAIPINEKYLVFSPINSIRENNATVGYEIQYEIRIANTYGLPEWWSTVAIIDRNKEKEVIIVLPSDDCEVYTIGQIDGIPQITLDKVLNRLKISLVDHPGYTNYNGKIELFLRIKESYTLLYVEIR